MSKFRECLVNDPVFLRTKYWTDARHDALSFSRRHAQLPALVPYIDNLPSPLPPAGRCPCSSNLVSQQVKFVLRQVTLWTLTKTRRWEWVRELLAAQPGHTLTLPALLAFSRSLYEESGVPRKHLRFRTGKRELDVERRDARSRRLLPADLVEGSEVEALFRKVSQKKYGEQKICFSWRQLRRRCGIAFFRLKLVAKRQLRLHTPFDFISGGGIYSCQPPSYSLALVVPYLLCLNWVNIVPILLCILSRLKGFEWYRAWIVRCHPDDTFDVRFTRPPSPPSEDVHSETGAVAKREEKPEVDTCSKASGSEEDWNNSDEEVRSNNLLKGRVLCEDLPVPFDDLHDGGLVVRSVERPVRETGILIFGRT